MRRTAACALLLVVAAACAGDGSEAPFTSTVEMDTTTSAGSVPANDATSLPAAPPEGAPTTAEPATTTAPPPVTTTIPGPVSPLQPLIDLAVADLAARLGIAPGDIEVISAEEVTWPDASLGCPQPGMAYAQVLTDGARIDLRAGGAVYSYHSGGGRDPFLCESPLERSEPPPTPGG